MGTFIYLIVSLLLAGFSLYVLYTGKYPFLRILCWIAFYLSAAAIAMLWLNFFFPEMSYEGTAIGFHLTLAFWGKICLIFSVAAGFFLWVYLRHKNSEISLDKIAKSISGSVTVFLLVVIVLISAAAFWTRSYQESKMVAANITKADIFPDKLVTESIALDDLFPKVGPNAIIHEGGSLCGTLGITKQYAKKFAKINHLKYHYCGDKLIVLVHQGDEFMPVGKLWTPVKKEKR
jgi:hypothetical protein